MMMLLRRRKNKKGQALIEFAFILPIIFLIFLVCLQFGILLVKALRTEISLWPALRGASMPTWGKWGSWYWRDICIRILFFKHCEHIKVPEGLFPRPIYSAAGIRAQIAQDIFGKDDTVSVSYADFTMNGKTFTRAKVTCLTPFLFKGLDWEPITEIFSKIGMGNIKLESSEAVMIKDTFSIWDQ